MSDVEQVLVQALERCRRVSAGAAELVPLLDEVMPYQGADASALPLIERTAAVAFIKRFEQLQDLIARLARASASWEGVDATSLTYRDIGDWLEKHRDGRDVANRMYSYLKAKAKAKQKVLV